MSKPRVTRRLNSILANAIDGVNTNNILEVALTRSKVAFLDVRGHIVSASNEIVCVLAIIGLSDRVEASLEAELVATDESMGTKSCLGHF